MHTHAQRPPAQLGVSAIECASGTEGDGTVETEAAETERERQREQAIERLRALPVVVIDEREPRDDDDANQHQRHGTNEPTRVSGEGSSDELSAESSLPLPDNPQTQTQADGIPSTTLSLDIPSPLASQLPPRSPTPRTPHGPRPTSAPLFSSNKRQAIDGPPEPLEGTPLGSVQEAARLTANFAAEQDRFTEEFIEVYGTSAEGQASSMEGQASSMEGPEGSGEIEDEDVRRNRVTRSNSVSCPISPVKVKRRQTTGDLHARTTDALRRSPRKPPVPKHGRRKKKGEQKSVRDDLMDMIMARVKSEGDI